MSKPRHLLVLGVMAVASIACFGVAAGAGARPSCLPPHAKTIAKDRAVVVYSRAGKALAQGGTYACLLSRGTTVALAKSGRYCCQLVGRITLAGAIVAYTESSHGVDSGCTDIAVMDVVHRRTLLRVPQVACYVDAGFIRFGQITDLLLTPHGSVAWIVHEGIVRQGATFKVHNAHAHGPPTLLDEGPAIVPGTLRLSHGVVSWDDAGQRRSARLP